MAEVWESNKKAMKAAFVLSIPVLIGYVFIGLAFGMMLASRGYNFFWAMLTCIVIYSGSSQFLVADLLAPGVKLINVAVLSFFISVRHVVYGLSMLKPFQQYHGLKKLYMIYSLSDETFSLHCAKDFPEDVDKGQCMFFISLFNQLYWVIGSGLGGICGDMLHINTEGIDFVMTALFLVIFIDQWREAKTHFPAITGVACSILCVVIFGPSNFILPAMILIVLLLTLARKRIEPVLAKGEERT